MPSRRSDEEGGDQEFEDDERDGVGEWFADVLSEADEDSDDEDACVNWNLCPGAQDIQQC